MKVGYLLCCLTLALAGYIPVRAEDSSDDQRAPSLQLRFPTGQASLESPLYVYGGGALKFTLAIEAPLGTRMRVTADLLQLASGGLAAPLQHDVPVTPTLSFEDRTYLQADCLLPALPDVQRKTTMLLKLKAQDPSSGVVSREVTLIVYPAAAPDTWTKAFTARLGRSGLRRLAVFGEGTALRAFLQSHKVPFDDLGEDWPDEPDTQTLYAGETRRLPLLHLDELPGLRVILFLPEANEQILPASVYQSSDSRGGTLLKVTLPNLLTAPADHPDALASLDEIFRRALEPHATLESTPDSTLTP